MTTRKDIQFREDANTEAVVQRMVELSDDSLKQVTGGVQFVPVGTRGKTCELDKAVANRSGSPFIGHGLNDKKVASPISENNQVQGVGVTYVNAMA